jgi:hypothetical protein
VPVPPVEIVFQLPVGERRRVGAFQPADDLLEARPGLAER